MGYFEVAPGFGRGVGKAQPAAESGWHREWGRALGFQYPQRESFVMARGAAAVVAAVWIAAKVLRIGLPMFGKPPDLATTPHWIRAA